MGQGSSIIKKINYEDLQKNIQSVVLLNTLPLQKQDCLIVNTISASDEERKINDLMNNKNYKVPIFIYGENTNDVSLFNKYNQLTSLGFTNIYIYPGGLFEWLCLQDIYGYDLFPTIKRELDILKYRPPSNYNKLSISYK